jgi:hypothetical protein
MNDETEKPNDPGILTEAEISKLRAEAKAKVAKEIRQAAMKAQLDEFEREERIAAGLAGKAEPPKKGRWPEYGPPPIEKADQIQLTINLPPFCDAIPVDGKIYFDGHTYWLSPSEHASLIEQMQYSWEHQDRNQITSKHDKFRQRNRGRDAHLIMGAVHPNVNTSRSLQ